MQVKLKSEKYNLSDWPVNFDLYLWPQNVNEHDWFDCQCQT